ncbi:MAE_28990/MAE_18760 family HEPN-like nuclease [Streptococcus dysgalactiae]|uniref:MAE_28990/MAE_18760 family HEPN-like nuclease n=1 Tax=Streptococcus dysgalactiae TaxID=1334 RepID=UPI003D9FD07A
MNQEIDRFLKLLQAMECSAIGIKDPELYQNFVIEIADSEELEAVFKSMKSNMIMMLYNWVEATVRTTMNSYYDRFNDSQLSYTQVVEKIKKLWLKYSIKEWKQDKLKEVFDLINNVIDEQFHLSLDFDKDFSLSGNADVREMKNILSRHGILFNDDSFNEYASALLSIKSMRNSLAHGNISFEDNGRDIAISDLKDYKEQVYNCLKCFISLVDTNIEKFGKDD